MDNPPPIWPPYLAKGEYWGIVEMEYGEAKKAVEGFKNGSMSICDAIKELGHVASAAAQARAHLMKLSEMQDLPEKVKV